MAPTLRKRKAPEAAPAPAPATKKAAAPKKTAAAAAPKKAAEPKKAAAAPAEKKASKQVAVGDEIDLDTFGGEIETNDGEKTTLKKLVEASGSGVVLFTYPKASTPGCKYIYSTIVRRPRKLTENRHQAGLLLPRCLRASHCRRPPHLRPQRGFAQGQHHLQGQAEAPVPSSL